MIFNLKNNTKCFWIIIVLLSTSVLSILFLQIDRTKLKIQISDKQSLLSSFIKDSNSRAKLEGMMLYNLLNIPKEKFLSIIRLQAREYSIFVVVDSIDCYSCFKFHIDYINELPKQNISIFSYSNLHSKFLANSLIKSVNFPIKEIYKHKVIDDSNMAIMLIDKVGKLFTQI